MTLTIQPTHSHRAVAPPPGHYTRCLREEYVRLCGGDLCAAMVLSQHEFWHTHNTRRRADGDPWSAVSHAQMREQLCGLFSVKRVGEAYRYLVAHGLLDQRRDPTHRWERTPQYRFRVEAVQAAVDALPPLTDPTDVSAQERSRLGPGAESSRPDSRDSSENTSPENSVKTSPQTPEALPGPGLGEDRARASEHGAEPGLALVGELVSFGIAFDEARTLLRDHGPARVRLALAHLPPYPTPVRQGRWVRKALAEHWAVGPPPREWAITGAADLDALLAAHGRLPVVLEVERRAALPGLAPALAERRRRVAAGLRAGLSGRAAHAAAGYAPGG